MTADMHLRCRSQIQSRQLSKVCSLPYAQLMLALVKQLDKHLDQQEHRHQHAEDSKHVSELIMAIANKYVMQRRLCHNPACAFWQTEVMQNNDELLSST